MSISKQPLKKAPVKRRSVSKPAVTAKVFDIARPGKTVADSTSRPVIITNRPVMQDPMMVSAKTDSSEAQIGSAPLLKPAKKVIIKPLHEDVVPEATIVETEPVAELVTPMSELPIEEVLTPKDTVPPPAAIADIATPAEPPSTDQTAPDTLAVQQRASELQQLINNERYFLPVNTVESKRSKRFAIAGLILIIILAAAWYDTALDAGLVTNTYNLPHSTFLVKN